MYYQGAGRLKNSQRSRSLTKSSRIRFFITLLGLLSILFAMGVWPDREDGFFDPFVVGLMGLSSIPFVIYAAFIKSRLGTVLSGWILLLATLAAHTLIVTSSSSTASLGFYGSLLLNFVLIALALLLEPLLRSKEGKP